MSSVVCSFCARDNPEGSKFCNECGSPLNLLLCSQCEAINNVSAKHCHQCGAPLSPTETGEQTIPPAPLTEIGQDAERATTKDDPVPIVLGERLDALHSGVESHESPATIAEEPSFPSASPADPSSHNDDGPFNPAHGGHANYSGRNSVRAHGLLVLVVVVVLAGAVYLAFVNPTHVPGPRTMSGEGNTTAPESATSAAPARSEPAENSKQSPTEDPLPAASPLPSSARSFVSPATSEESMSTSAEARPSTADSSGSSATARDSKSLGAAPPAAVPPPEDEAAQAASHTGEAESSGGGTAKITSARANGLPRRMVGQGRTKEQAERDAIATQRLITRELTDSP